MAFTWQGSSGLTFTDITTTPADKILAFLNIAITANLANSLFSWQVATYNVVSPKYLMLSRKDGTAGRILIFGQSGSTPNAAATYVAPASGLLYISYSATSTSNTITTSYLTGIPLSDTDYIRGIAFATDLITNSTRTDYRLIYYDTEVGLVFGLSSVTGGSFVMNFAGELILDTSNTPISCCSGSGTTTCPTGWYASQSDANNCVARVNMANNTSYVAGASTLIARIAGTNYQVYRSTMLPSAATITSTYDATSQRCWFVPLVLSGPQDVTAIGQFGRMRQMAFGPLALRDAIFVDAATGLTAAYPITFSTTTASGALWLINYDI